jgi:hypothetical protein
MVARIWRAHTDKPLRIIGSTTLVNDFAFYFADQPSAFNTDVPKETAWSETIEFGVKVWRLLVPRMRLFACAR